MNLDDFWVNSNLFLVLKNTEVFWVSLAPQKCMKTGDLKNEAFGCISLKGSLWTSFLIGSFHYRQISAQISALPSMMIRAIAYMFFSTLTSQIFYGKSERPSSEWTPLRQAVSMAKSKLQKTRESKLIGKAELARKAGISPITIARIEQGMPCRIDTKRKILLALGYSLTDVNELFDEWIELRKLS